MGTEFTREARYVVLKSADVMQCLAVSELIELRRIQAKVEEHRAEIGKPPLDCVVVESDWPEYEPTWNAIEARMTGAQPAPSEGSITAGILSGMFLSLDGHDKAQPGYEWRKGWNDAIRQAMDYAQPPPSINPAALSPVINWLRNGCDPMKAADELEMLADAQEDKP